MEKTNVHKWRWRILWVWIVIFSIVVIGVLQLQYDLIKHNHKVEQDNNRKAKITNKELHRLCVRQRFVLRSIIIFEAGEIEHKHHKSIFTKLRRLISSQTCSIDPYKN